MIRLVRSRAAGNCEYCGLPHADSVVPFEIDYILARRHGGASTDDNLAWSCFYCNSAKGPNIAGIDPESNDIVRLFHPRRDRWPDHFRWNFAMILGISPVGRTTVRVLQMNHPDMLELRVLLLKQGNFPPEVFTKLHAS